MKKILLSALAFIVFAGTAFSQVRINTEKPMASFDVSGKTDNNDNQVATDIAGVSDLIILSTISGILESEKREGLRGDVTLVPTGGLEKVATFISLLRGSKLDIVCLLDSYNDDKGKAKMDTLIAGKIMQKNKIRFFLMNS